MKEIIARKAYGTVPFYQRLTEIYNISEDAAFIELPIIDKGEIVKSRSSMISSAYIGKYITGRLNWIRTSGSSGLMSEIYWDEIDERKSMRSLWLLRKKYYGISPKNRLCYFFPADTAGERYVNRKKALAVSKSVLYDGMIDDAFQRIKEYRPEWMILQPSIALILCNLSDQFGSIHGIRYIEFTGEYLERSIRKRVEETFHCAVANQYGTKEVNSIAYECPCGNMHVMTDNVFLETDGDYFCVTSLRNQAMPFIRYRLEDTGILQRKTDCRCGICGDTIVLRHGRCNDLIRHKDGSTSHPYSLMQIIHEINYRTDGAILQYQIVQKDYGKFVFYIVLDEESEEYQSSIANQMIGEVSERMNTTCEVEIHFSRELLPDRNTGKHKAFISEMEADENERRSRV